MKKIDYEKILKQLLEEYPHELDKIEKVITDARKDEDYYFFGIEYDKIIKSNIWDVDEKVRLLTFLGHNKYEHKMDYVNQYGNNDTMKDYEYMIKYDLLSGFEALMKTYKDIKIHDNNRITKDEAYRNIFNEVIISAKEEIKAEYLKVILNNLTIDDIKRLIAPYYTGHYIAGVCNESIFKYIIASKNLDLIKEYICYIDDINMYLQEAVATKDIEIVKYFLENGADVNYLTDEVILGRLTPLKMAIANNDYEMFKFLIDNGADVNLQINSDDFVDRINNRKINIYDNWNRIKPIDANDDDAMQLKYIRESSPLEYATKLSSRNYDIYEFSSDSFNIYFNGASCMVKNDIILNTHRIPVEVINRGKIVDLIFDKLEDKTSIDYNDLIGFTFITRDAEMLKKYVNYIGENKGQVDLDRLFDLYFRLNVYSEEEMLEPFMDLIGKYDKDTDMYLKFFNSYIVYKSRRYHGYLFYANDFQKKLLNAISEEKRKKICLVPYCKDLESLKYLLSLGFDLKQVDSNGENILYHLIRGEIRTSFTSIPDCEVELFNYLVENIDLSMKDNDNKNILYYAMQRFSAYDDFYSARKNRVITRSEIEKQVAVLISEMPQQEVCNDDIKEALEKRLKFDEHRGSMDMEVIYQHHKELFDALIDKGFVLSDEMLLIIFKALYPDDETRKERLQERVDIDKTLDYVYEKLDRNTEIQKIDIEKELESFISYIDSAITFDEFGKRLQEFEERLNSLNAFYENNIKKKFNPEKYLEYAHKRYNTIYCYDKEGDMDKYLTLIIIRGIIKFGEEKLGDILDLIPNYNINNYIIEEDIGFKYWKYVDQIEEIIGVDDEGYPICGNEHFEAEGVYETWSGNIEFTGNLMQYAILTDNLDMVKQLQKRGAKLEFLLDDGDYTWNYVNSYTMMNYIETTIGRKKHLSDSNLNKEERDYYSSLIGLDDNIEDEKPKVFAKKR